MSARPEVLEIVQRWISKAEGDLLTAEHTMKLGALCPYFAVCFHSQQCAEKYLKGYLTFLEVHAPKTHNLKVLFDLIPIATEMDLRIDELEKLSIYGVEVRYPDEIPDPTPEEARRAIEMARHVRDAVREALPSSTWK